MKTKTKKSQPRQKQLAPGWRHGNASLTVLIIVIVAIVAGGVGWMLARNTQKPATEPQSLGRQGMLVGEQAQQKDLSGAEYVYVGTDNEEVKKININDRKIKSIGGIGSRSTLGFSGLPFTENNGRMSIKNRVYLMARDRKKAIVESVTYDETSSPSEFDGSLPILKREEFICSDETKACVKTDIVKNADLKANSIGERNISWLRWDEVNNRLIGHVSGEGVGNATPVYVYDINFDKLTKTDGYGYWPEGSLKRAEVPSGFANHSLTEFAMIDNTTKPMGTTLLIYDMNNLSSPKKTFDLTELFGNNAGKAAQGVNAIAWSPDDKQIALGNEMVFYTLDIANGKLSKIYEDQTFPNDFPYAWDHNVLVYSTGGRYLVFIDYGSDAKDSLGSTMKAIDLENSNQIIEIGDLNLSIEEYF